MLLTMNVKTRRPPSRAYKTLNNQIWCILPRTVCPLCCCGWLGRLQNIWFPHAASLGQCSYFMWCTGMAWIWERGWDMLTKPSFFLPRYLRSLAKFFWNRSSVKIVVLGTMTHIMFCTNSTSMIVLEDDWKSANDSAGKVWAVSRKNVANDITLSTSSVFRNCRSCIILIKHIPFRPQLPSKSLVKSVSTSRWHDCAIPNLAHDTWFSIHRSRELEPNTESLYALSWGYCFVAHFLLAATHVRPHFFLGRLCDPCVASSSCMITHR